MGKETVAAVEGIPDGGRGVGRPVATPLLGGPIRLDHAAEPIRIGLSGWHRRPSQ
jgi:hypothetical protein